VSTETGGPGRPVAPGAGTGARVRAVFDLDLAWCLSERVAVRPKSFGALLYHFGTRRLSFLKDTVVLAVLPVAG
jgi:mycofactocin biosynthesis protein MftB